MIDAIFTAIWFVLLAGPGIYLMIIDRPSTWACNRPDSEYMDDIAGFPWLCGLLLSLVAVFVVMAFLERRCG